jgi:alkylation response protein AidB-like acyl-CoA dehydrogenase
VTSPSAGPATSSADELRALRDATRRLVGARTPGSANEHVVATAAPPDRAHWSALAEQLGLQGVRIPEEHGGVGLGLVEELLVHEELGRALHGGPFLPVVAQVTPVLLGHLGQEPVPALLEGIAAGETVVVPAFAGWYDAEASLPVLDEEGRVTGVVPSVMEPIGADHLLVVAEQGADAVLLLVDGRSERVTSTRLPAVDLTRRFADVHLDGAPATELARGDEARRAAAQLESGAALALCADSVGLAGAAFEMTIDHLKIREQFGQVLGAFQGLKHQAAELLVLLESARSALAFAQDAQRSGDDDLATAALAVARRRCGSAAFRITNEAIHLHGGIGFTWEHRVHLFHRRAKTNEVLLDARGGQARVLASTVFDLYARDHALGER